MGSLWKNNKNRRFCSFRLEGASMDIIIYGAGYYGKKLLSVVKKYQDVNILGFADSNLTGSIGDKNILDIFHNVERYRKLPIVISVASFEDRYSIYLKLKDAGFEYIYFYLRKEYCYKGKFLENECVSLRDIKNNTLFYAEMSIVDFCNLNCKGCNHYSPIFDKKYPDIEIRMRDIKKISELYDRVIEFGLIGGEPLLNPQIKEYIQQTRQLLPNTEIQMVTNGLLIPNLDHDILKCMSDNKITIAISEYIPTMKIIEKITNTLRNHNIDYVLKPAMFKEKFYKTLSLKSDSNYSKKCISQGCINICDGRIAKCPTVLYIETLNKKFNVNFPTDGIYLLENFEVGEELNKALEKKLPLCEYCIDYQIKWEPCSNDKRLEDFVVVE